MLPSDNKQTIYFHLFVSFCILMHYFFPESKKNVDSFHTLNGIRSYADPEIGSTLPPVKDLYVLICEKF
jgi:hypothetical protein